MVTETIEDYLKTILLIEGRKGYAQVKDVAEDLGVKPPSVTEMFRRLDRLGLINYERYGGATLTAKGRHIASMVRERHQAMKKLFMIMGVEEETADADACRVEHALSDDTFDRLSKFVDFVNESERRTAWLDHYDVYCEKGEYSDCCSEHREGCPLRSGEE